VEIHFCEIDDADPVTASDETDAYNPIPGSEFVLARTVRLDNTSFYTLNGKRQTFEDIEVFMKTKGIDINNNRFLILQGEVEAISMMKPKGENKHEEGMLEFLEELIGTDKYVEDIEKGQALVETLSQNRAIKLEQVKVGEKEMAALEGPKDEAMRFRFLETSIAENKCKIVAARLKQCEAKCEEAEANKTAVSESFASQRKELDEIKGQVNALDDELKSKKEGHVLIVKALEDHKEAFAKFERKNIKDEAKSKQLQAKVDKLQASLEESRKAKETAQEKIEDLEGTLPKLTAEMQKQESSLAKAEETLEDIRMRSRDEAKVVREKIEKKQTELQPLSNKASEAESEVSILDKELALLEGPTKEAQVKLEAAKEERKAAKAAVKELPRSVEEQKELLEEATAELKNSAIKIEMARQKETTLENECANISAILKTAAVSAGGKSGKGSALSRLVEATKRGGALDGCQLLGRLGDLGSIPDEYDAAATTAAGNALDSFVTKTTEDAERCVSFLRKEQLGVATFIILDKVAKVPQAEASSFPATRVFDLVKPVNESVLPAFYHALKDTLVCKDLDEAVSVAYDEANVCRWRVVTLKGELIDRSGTMSGGGKPRKGGFSNSPSTASDELSEKEVKELNAKLTQLESELKACRAEIAKETKMSEKLAVAKRSAEDAIEKLKQDLETVEQKVKIIEARIAELETRCTLSLEDKAKTDAIHAQLKVKIPLRDEAKASAEKIERELQLLNTELNEVGGAQAKLARDHVENIRKKLDKARADLTKCQVGIDAAKQALQKAESIAEKAGAEHELALVEQETHESEREKTAERAKEAQEKFKKASEEETAARAVVERIKKEYNEAKARYNALESGSTDMKIKLETAEEELKKAYARRTKWQADLEQARSRLEQWRKTIEDKEGAAADGQEEGGESKPEIDLSDNDLGQLENEVQRLEAEAKTLRGNVNMGAIAEYKAREKEYLEKVKELDEASLARDQARAQVDDLKKRRLVEFMAGFSIISLKLKEIYQLITLGGDAELELVDSLDPFSEGVVFSVRPPKKSWKNISNLSGGEKTLSSLSLVFALHAFRGAPIYVMDEIDAALDFKNVSIVANYIKERTKNAQFLIISLRNNMFELADRLVGVYKTNNATKSVTINPDRVAMKSGIAHDEDGKRNDGDENVMAQ